MTGIYVHIPFCKSKCGYCAFNSRPTRGAGELSDYFRALHRELDDSSAWLSSRQVGTIYFGGGTPSMADPRDLTRLLGDIRSAAGSLSDNPEITIEANPETVGPDKLAAFFDAGFNRLSLGAQSFDLQALAFLERAHRPKQVEKAMVEARKAGFGNISLDLIVGLPKPHFDAFRADIRRAAWLEPEHLSVYLLSAEEPSRLFEAVSAGKIPWPDSDAQADCYLDCHRFLTQEGFEHYEVSNFGMPGFFSRHNQAYWDGSPYLGLGAGAHSFIPGDEHSIRRANTSDPTLYLDQVSRGEDPVDFSEIITPAMALSEKLMLELRTARGLCPADYGNHAKALQSKLEELSKNGWYEWDGRRFHPTAEGFLVADGVASLLVDLIEA